MLFTGFDCPECDTTFWVRYAVEQHVSDIDFCPSCGQKGRVDKEQVKELDGLIVSAKDVKER